MGPRAGWGVAGGLLVLAVGAAQWLGGGRAEPGPDEIARQAWVSVDQQTRDTMCVGMRRVPGSMPQILREDREMSPELVEATMAILAEEC
ncbi:hypothetical protein [Nocardioides zeicaulis]|uniref:DUF732 domain-containing protein n=1 Tax=Nocardioides zeicaulis TaxID=1776857 RepID=A0ABV6E5H8_9ACTN